MMDEIRTRNFNGNDKTLASRNDELINNNIYKQKEWEVAFERELALATLINKIKK